MGVFLNNPQMIAALLDPGIILFGFMILLFGAAFVCVFLLKQVPALIEVLTGLLILIELALIGNLSLNLFLPGRHVITENMTELSEIFLTHRWLLYQLPVLLILLSIILLLVYHKQILARHAKSYFWTLHFSITLSFFTILTAAFESII